MSKLMSNLSLLLALLSVIVGGAYLSKSLTPVTKKTVKTQNIESVQKASTIMTEIEPVVSGPVVSGPVVSEPVVSEPVVSEPVVVKPVVVKPVVVKPVVVKPVVVKPAVTKDEVKLTQAAPLKIEAPQVSQSNLLIRLGSSISTSLHRFDDPRKSTSSDFSVTPIMNFSNGISLVTGLSITKDLNGLREQRVNDSFVAVSKTITNINEKLSLKASAVAILPISKNSRLNTTLVTGLKIKPSLNFIHNSFNAQAGLGLTKNFHRSQISFLGSSNNEYHVSPFMGFGYDLNDKISLGMSGSYTKAYTYQKNERDSYSLDQNISYAPNQEISLSLGHSIGGNVLATNEQEYEIDFFNENFSSIYMTFGFLFK